MSLINNAWQTTPGANHLAIYPFIRRIDSTCSNAFVVSAPSCVVIIDPGADDEQSRAIEELVLQVQEQGQRPVMVVLTHCHRDHSLAALELLQRHSSWLLAVQENGARAMRAGDNRLTMSYMFSEEYPKAEPQVDLLAAIDAALPGTRKLPAQHGRSMSLITDVVGFESGPGRLRQKLMVDDQRIVEFYHAPGHSPDSMIIRAGGVLFIGDMFNAVNPAVAGAVGWDNNQLKASLAMLEDMLGHNDIGVCCGGHGQPMTVEQAGDLLRKVQKEAAQLGDALLLDEERVAYLKEYAAGTLNEIDHLFTVVAGRLFSLSHTLEQLEENELAERVLATLDIDAIDRLITDFHQYAHRLRDDNLIMRVPMRGLLMLKKINRILREANMEEFVDPLIRRRIRGLLLDYIDALRGLPFGVVRLRRGLNQFAESFINEISALWPETDDMMANVDDHDAFAAALARHIALRQALPALHLTLLPSAPETFALVDHDRCTDLLVDLIERFHGAGAEAVEIRVGSRDGNPCLTLRPSPAQGLGGVPQGKKRLWEMVSRIAGCQLLLEPESATILLEPAD